MRKSKIRIRVPSGSKERIELLEKIIEQHKKLGKKSSLLNLKAGKTSINWDDIEGELKKARNFQDEIDKLEKTISKTEQNRDLLLLLLYEIIKKSKRSLKKTHAGNLTKLREHGFEVLENKDRLMY